MNVILRDPNGQGGAPETGASFADQGAQDFGSAIGARSVQREAAVSEPTPGPGNGGPPAQSDTQQGSPPRFRTQHAHTAPQGGDQPAADPGQAQEQTPVQPAAPGQSQADVIKAAVEATAAALGRQQQPATQTPPSNDDRELSPQEFNAKYKVVQATEADVAALLDQDPKKATVALNRLLQGAAQQAVLMALDLSRAEVARVQNEFNPHITSWKQHQAEIQAQKAEQDFFKAYPDLTAERELVMEMKDAILARVQNGQLKFSSTQEAYKAVADATKNLLTRFGRAPNGQGGTNGGGAGQPQGQTQGRQMAAASSAGRTGNASATARTDVDKLIEHWSANP